MRARVVLVDDQVLFVESLTDVLKNRAPDIEVVAVGYNGHDALELARKHRPDIILLDVRMPEMSGVGAVKAIHNDVPETRIVMLTTYDDDEYVSESVENGAIGYLLKDMPAEDVIAALRAVKGGAFLLPADIAQKLLRPETGTVYHGGIGEKRLPDWYYQLSQKERRMLRLLVERYSNREIAQRVHLAEQTVKNYLSSIYDSIGVHGRKEAIEVAKEYLHFL